MFCPYKVAGKSATFKYDILSFTLRGMEFIIMKWLISVTNECEFKTVLYE